MTHELCDWFKDVSIAVRTQPALAVYTNNEGAVVIRQERTMWQNMAGEDEPFIIVQPEHAVELARAILREADVELSAPAAQLALPAPTKESKSKSDAERAREYRRRKRHAAVTENVTPVTRKRDAFEPMEVAAE